MRAGGRGLSGWDRVRRFWRERKGRRHLRWVLPLVVVVLVVVVWGGVDADAFLGRIRGWPAVWAVLSIGVLPLAGVPVSMLHLAAGLRFEFWAALLVVAGTTLFQQVSAWALVRCLPGRLFTRLEPWRERLAGAGHREAATLSCLIPGMPYTVQLYLLPVMGLSLSTICAICVPLHVIRAVATILLGNLGDELSPCRLAALGAYYLVVFGGCGWVLRRMRVKLHAARAAEDGRTAEARSG